MSSAPAWGAETSSLTRDRVARGELELLQPQRGYRFNLDALLLAHFACSCVTQEPESVVDLGSGCGVVGLLLARQWPSARVLLVELQPELAELARRNAAHNRLAGQVSVLCADLKQSEAWSAFSARRSVVVSNPPFFALGRGHISPNPMVAAAKHELTCTLDELVISAAKGLTEHGYFVLIHAADRRAELIARLERQRLLPFRLRMVQPYAGRPPTRMLVAARRASTNADNTQAGARWVRGASEAEPLIVHSAPGRYSDEVRRLLGD